MRRDGRAVREALLVCLLGMSWMAAAERRGTSDEARQTIAEVAGDHLERTVRCEGHGVAILGNDSRLLILGPCTEVRVLGSRNGVTVGDARRVVTRGDQNTVEYTERRTRVSDLGKGNAVVEKWPQ